MNTCITIQDRIRAAEDTGFTFTDRELETLNVTPVITKDINVIIYATQLSRKVGSSLLTLRTLDFAVEIPAALGLNHKLVGVTAFAIFALAKYMANRIYGGDIVAYDHDFYAQLEDVNDGAAVREAIKRDMYTIAYPDDKEHKVRIYGISRMSGNSESRTDVEIDVENLSPREIEKLIIATRQYCDRRISEGKIPTIIQWLTNMTTYNFVTLEPVRNTSPLKSPGVHLVNRIKMV